MTKCFGRHLQTQAYVKPIQTELSLIFFRLRRLGNLDAYIVRIQNSLSSASVSSFFLPNIVLPSIPK
jgi:hypothetical protein